MKKVIFAIGLALVMSLMCGGVATANPTIEKTAPTNVGIEPKQVMLMYDSLMNSDLTEIHHVVVMVDGKIVSELHPKPFRAEHRHTLYSVSKTFTAVAMGLLVDDGLLSVEDTFGKFFPEYMNDEIDPRLREIKVKDILTMRSGFKTQGGMRNSQEHWIKYYLSRPLFANPGTRYSYDSIETYLLSAIVQKITGKTVLDLLNERVFGPMGITDAEWELCPDGIVVGGWGIYISSHSQALFGQLLLQQGEWNGKQLISKEWVKEMMTVRVVRDANDYGYQVWLCEYPGAWRADGAFGQYIIMVPQKNMVVVLNQCSRSKGWPERGNIWNTVVKNALNCTIEAKPAELKALADYEESAQLPVLAGDSTNVIAKRYNGKTFALDKNKLGWKSVKFGFADGKTVLTVVDAEGKESNIELGYKKWITSALAGFPHYSISAKGRFSGLTGPFYTGSCYAWNAGNFEAKIHYVNWITSLKLTFNFDGKNMTVYGEENFTAKPFVMTGKMK
jgi:CubicO group peptidase (beta-lactamase class C family)